MITLTRIDDPMVPCADAGCPLRAAYLIESDADGPPARLACHRHVDAHITATRGGMR